MTKLIRYENALYALAQCKAVDEAKDWADKAAAMQAYGRMAKDKTLEVDAAEIRIRAERRLGEILAATEKNVGHKFESAGGSSSEPPAPPTLASQGIDKKLSTRAQKIAAIPEHEFEKEVAEHRERISAEGARVTARLESLGEKKKPAAPETDWKAKYDELFEQFHEAQKTASELIADNNAMGAVFDSDDKLAEATKKIAQLLAENRVLQERVNGLMNEKNRALQELKSAQRKIKKLETVSSAGF